MNDLFPFLTSVCAIIQREETRTKNSNLQSSSEKVESSALVAHKNDRRNTSEFEKKKVIVRTKGRREPFFIL